MTTFREITTRSPDFEQVLELRRTAYGRTQAGREESIDSYSRHFCAFENAELVGALRVTCGRDGRMEAERWYPQWLLDSYRNVLCAASRLVVKQQWRGRNLQCTLQQFAWSQMIREGIRLGVSPARLQLVPAYMRGGLYFVRDSFFDFPSWNVECVLLGIPVNAHRNSLYRNTFAQIEESLDLETSPNGDCFIDSVREFKRLNRQRQFQSMN